MYSIDKNLDEKKTEDSTKQNVKDNIVAPQESNHFFHNADSTETSDENVKSEHSGKFEVDSVCYADEMNTPKSDSLDFTLSFRNTSFNHEPLANPNLRGIEIPNFNEIEVNPLTTSSELEEYASNIEDFPSSVDSSPHIAYPMHNTNHHHHHHLHPNKPVKRSRHSISSYAGDESKPFDELEPDSISTFADDEATTEETLGLTLSHANVFDTTAIQSPLVNTHDERAVSADIAMASPQQQDLQVEMIPTTVVGLASPTSTVSTASALSLSRLAANLNTLPLFINQNAQSASFYPIYSSSHPRASQCTFSALSSCPDDVGGRRWLMESDSDDDEEEEEWSDEERVRIDVDTSSNLHISSTSVNNTSNATGTPLTTNNMKSSSATSATPSTTSSSSSSSAPVWRYPPLIAFTTDFNDPVDPSLVGTGYEHTSRHWYDKYMYNGVFVPYSQYSDVWRRMQQQQYQRYLNQLSQQQSLSSDVVDSSESLPVDTLPSIPGIDDTAPSAMDALANPPIDTSIAVGAGSSDTIGGGGGGLGSGNDNNLNSSIYNFNSGGDINAVSDGDEVPHETLILHPSSSSHPQHTHNTHFNTPQSPSFKPLPIGKCPISAFPKLQSSLDLYDSKSFIFGDLYPGNVQQMTTHPCYHYRNAAVTGSGLDISISAGNTPVVGATRSGSRLNLELNTNTIGHISTPPAPTIPSASLASSHSNTNTNANTTSSANMVSPRAPTLSSPASTGSPMLNTTLVSNAHKHSCHYTNCEQCLGTINSAANAPGASLKKVGSPIVSQGNTPSTSNTSTNTSTSRSSGSGFSPARATISSSLSSSFHLGHGISINPPSLAMVHSDDSDEHSPPPAQVPDQANPFSANVISNPSLSNTSTTVTTTSSLGNKPVVFLDKFISVAPVMLDARRQRLMGYINNYRNANAGSAANEDVREDDGEVAEGLIESVNAVEPDANHDVDVADHQYQPIGEFSASTTASSSSLTTDMPRLSPSLTAHVRVQRNPATQSPLSEEHLSPLTPMMNTNLGGSVITSASTRGNGIDVNGNMAFTGLPPLPSSSSSSSSTSTLFVPLLNAEAWNTLTQPLVTNQHRPIKHSSRSMRRQLQQSQLANSTLFNPEQKEPEMGIDSNSADDTVAGKYGVFPHDDDDRRPIH